MSHYAVAVFSDDADFDSLLAPYNESDRRYFTFVPVAYKDIISGFEKFKEQNPNYTLGQYVDVMGYILNENGQWGYEHNEHGYWDWYTLDGKSYMFDVREDYEPDAEGDDWNGYYRKNDYDWFKADPDDEIDAEEFWDKFIDGDCEEDYPSFYSKDYYRERYKTKEQFVKERSRTIPYAFVTPDGVWHAPGRVGWFACSDETAEDSDRYAEEWYAYLRSEGNPYVSLVDCHI